MNFAIDTTNLGRIYKIRGAKKNGAAPKDAAQELVALQDINLQVNPGELFGLLGPNGAGKTTLIKILTTLLAPSHGAARVAGFDVAGQAAQVRRCINMVSGGESSGYGLLTVRENLWMFAQFYGIPSSLAHKRIDELLQIVGLSDRAHTKSSDLSTGLRQKMNIVRGFMTDPQVLFLDEPTLGLDVGASREVRRFVRRWVDEDRSRTLLLTTHYMVEADELCDRVAIINKGRVLACDTPDNLKRALQREAIFRLEVTGGELRDSAAPQPGLERFAALPGVRQFSHSRQDGFAVLEVILAADDALGGLIGGLAAAGLHIQHLQKREPTLEDVFVELVGRRMEDVERSE
ncbi:MAG: ATP-binding cassette domain-containing protein [Chloroflexota bacterium]